MVWFQWRLTTVVAVILTQLIYKKIDVTFALNGALAGLVAITAEPLMPSALQAILIGGVGGALVVFTVPLLDKVKIDDVVGAIPVHLIAGIFGTMIVPLSNPDASYGVQLLGVVSIGAFTVIASAIVWTLLKITIGVRPSEQIESDGLDTHEVKFSPRLTRLLPGIAQDMCKVGVFLYKN